MQTRRAGRKTSRAAQVCACLVIFVGLVTLQQYLQGSNGSIGQPLIEGQLGASTALWPRLIVPLGALGFLIIGVALLLLDVETRRGHRPAQFLILLEGVIAWMTLIAYIYGILSLHESTWDPIVAPYIPLAFVVACLGILFARQDRGLVAILIRDSVGGLVARRLLFVTSFAPVILDMLTMSGRRAGFYGPRFGAAMHATLVGWIFTLIILGLSLVLDRSDIARKRTELQIRRLNEDLGRRILERTAQLEDANQELRAEIAERKRVEEQLRKLSRAVEESPSTVIITDAKGNIEYVNPKFAQLTGYTSVTIVQPLAESSLGAGFGHS